MNELGYHTIELPGGQVMRGIYDLRPHLPEYGFPDRLDGKQVLDVGAADGFFSFEFERRGAKRVLAIDTNRHDGSLAIDPSPFARGRYIKKYAAMAGGDRFQKLKAILGSSVEFRYQSVYELASRGEKYDLVFCGDLIEHLKSPLIALENLRVATRDLCIISLSGALPSPRLGKLVRRISRAAIRALRLEGDFILPDRALEYMGFEGGGAFFRFTPSAFERALLASGFNSVSVYSGFDLPNLKNKRLSHHVIFHCK